MQDRARIHVSAGAGGDGCLSFRREAHVPKGGPDGGDGGRGGDVVLVCSDSLRDLETFRRKPHYKARKAGNGEGSLRHGADGSALELTVPPGTEVLVERDGTRHDLIVPGQRAVISRGGLGGRGNKRFAGPTHQTPRFAERGLPGEESWLTLRLKLLADVGLIGVPNAGKSSLLSRLTRAQPKVAGYPFTTLSPVLGTLEAHDRQLVIADIPGLIEGASDGAGLGHEFLAHVERTRLLVHVLDLAPLDGSDPFENHTTVERELASHDPRLATLPRILALSKADLVSPADAEAARELWSEELGEEVPVMITSSATHAGLQALADELMRLVPEAPAHGGETLSVITAGGGTGTAGLDEHRMFRPTPPSRYTVRRTGEGIYAVDGEGIERLLARYDIENEEALAHLERRLKGIGVLRALEAEGFEAGDEVQIAGIAFDLDPDL
jgi:GTP-binding protein